MKPNVHIPITPELGSIINTHQTDQYSASNADVYDVDDRTGIEDEVSPLNGVYLLSCNLNLDLVADL